MKKHTQADLMQELTDAEMIKALYGTQAAILLLAAALSYLFLDRYRGLAAIIDWSDPAIWSIGLVFGAVIAFIDLVLMRILPPSYYDDGGINERIFGSQPLWHIALIAAVVAVAEEWLFRVVIQTTAGFWAASILFAVIHIRYLTQWFLTANVFLLSFVIGFVFDYTGNLAVTIVLHFAIDFLLGVAIRVQNSKE